MVQLWHNFHFPSFSGQRSILVLADDIQFSLVGAADALPISYHHRAVYGNHVIYTQFYARHVAGGS